MYTIVHVHKLLMFPSASQNCSQYLSLATKSIICLIISIFKCRMRSLLTENVTFPFSVMAHVRAAKLNETVCACVCLCVDDSVFKQHYLAAFDVWLPVSLTPTSNLNLSPELNNYHEERAIWLSFSLCLNIFIFTLMIKI